MPCKIGNGEQYVAQFVGQSGVVDSPGFDFRAQLT